MEPVARGGGAESHPAAAPFLLHAAGAGVILLLVGYFIWISLKQRAVAVRGWRLDLPGFKVSLGQTILGAGDVCAGAAVLFMLLPAGHGMSFDTFLAVYVLACMLGIVSHSPGGLGVFEATMLIALSHLPREGVLGAVLLFRVFYYLLPFVLALVMLLIHTGWTRMRGRPRDLPRRVCQSRLTTAFMSAAAPSRLSSDGSAGRGGHRLPAPVDNGR